MRSIEIVGSFEAGARSITAFLQAHAGQLSRKLALLADPLFIKEATV